MDCPDCNKTMEFVNEDSRQEWYEVIYFCNECKKQFIRLVNFETQSNQVASDVLKEDYEVNNENLLRQIEKK